MKLNAYLVDPSEILSYRESFKPRLLVLIVEGRGGSVLLHSLLDGHPEVVTFPELLLYGVTHFWRRHQGRTRDLLDDFPKHFAVFFDADSGGVLRSEGMRTLGLNRDQVWRKDQRRFMEILEVLAPSQGDWSLVDFFRDIHIAQALSDDDFHPKTIMLYHTHSPHDPVALVDMKVIDPQFLTIIVARELRATYDSYFNRMSTVVPCPMDYPGWIRQWRSALLVVDLLLSMERIQQYCAPENSCVVRLEDLHNHSQAVMQDVANWLGITYRRCLLRSEFGGLPWSGDPPGKNGFSPMEIAWGKRDCACVEWLWQPRARNYGYQVHQISIWRWSFWKSLMVPHRYEQALLKKAFAALTSWRQQLEFVQLIKDFELESGAKPAWPTRIKRFLLCNITMFSAVFAWWKRSFSILGRLWINPQRRWVNLPVMGPVVKSKGNLSSG